MLRLSSGPVLAGSAFWGTSTWGSLEKNFLESIQTRGTLGNEGYQGVRKDGAKGSSWGVLHFEKFRFEIPGSGFEGLAPLQD